jgi:prophage regulatory protein
MQPNTPQALIRRKEVERLTTLSRSRIYALMQQGTFPKPISLGKMSVAWLESEIQEWIAARIAEFRKLGEAEHGRSSSGI